MLTVVVELGNIMSKREERGTRSLISDCGRLASVVSLVSNKGYIVSGSIQSQAAFFAVKLLGMWPCCASECAASMLR